MYFIVLELNFKMLLSILGYDIGCTAYCIKRMRIEVIVVNFKLTYLLNILCLFIELHQLLRLYFIFGIEIHDQVLALMFVMMRYY